MGRRGTARCRTCRAPIVFFRPPHSNKQCPFDPKPVDPSHPLAGLKAFPVLGGSAAYKPAALAEHLQIQRGCSDADAADEIRDMPWHLIHECPPDEAGSC